MSSSRSGGREGRRAETEGLEGLAAVCGVGEVLGARARKQKMEVRVFLNAADLHGFLNVVCGLSRVP